jgi:hypothetical protein
MAPEALSLDSNVVTDSPKLHPLVRCLCTATYIRHALAFHESSPSWDSIPYFSMKVPKEEVALFGPRSEPARKEVWFLGNGSVMYVVLRDRY